MQWEISVPLELQLRMQDSTGVVRELGVLLELGWYSGFPATCGGASCRVLLGLLFSSRDVQGGSSLVAMMGECSLDLARDYPIMVVRVHSVIAGV